MKRILFMCACAAIAACTCSASKQNSWASSDSKYPATTWPTTKLPVDQAMPSSSWPEC